MTFLQKLDYLMSLKGLNRKQLSKECGVKYTTIMNLYENGYDNMKLSNLKKFCEYFGVTLDYLVRDEITEIEYYNPNQKDIYFTKEEQFLINCYRTSDALDKELALRALKADEKGDTEKMA